MIRRVIASALGLIIGMAGGCAPKPDYLFVDPSRGNVRVELRRTLGVIRRSESPVPLTDCAFYRLPPPGDASGRPPEELWRILSLSPDHAALEIRYGIIPEGFTQVTPVDRPPPPLASGDRYAVECTGDGIGVTEFRMPE
ncbi:MAG: hypothetical protein ACREQY_13215 [Candidatus Binatia bacterium]